MRPMKTSALLVGINQYPGSPLQGCVNDIRAWLNLLTERFGVAPKDIHTLVDRQATRTAITSELQWLAGTGADVCLFIYSGHGTRVLDRDGDEKWQHSGTRYDQAIVPVDYNTAGFILDDDLGAIYWTFPKDTRLVVHLDSCFSAKSERGLLATLGALRAKHIQKRTPRMLPPHLVPAHIWTGARDQVTARAPIPRRDNLILISGCRDNETSADAYLNGRYRGAMSYMIEASLRALSPNANYSQVVTEARKRLAATGFSQIPQLSGPAEWLKLPAYT